MNIEKKSGLQFQRVDDTQNQSRRNRNVGYQSDSLKGIQDNTALNQLFFCRRNIQIIQNAIRREVYEASNRQHLIDEQNETELVVIMRSIYLQYARNLPNQITEQISELNSRVVAEILPKIMSAIEQHYGYLRDASTLPTPMLLPQNVSNAGSKTLELKPFI